MGIQRNRSLSTRLGLVLLCALLSLSVLYAQEGISISAAPTVSLPMGETADLYQLGVGGEMEIKFPLVNSPFALFGELNYQNVQLQSEAGNLHLLMGGGGLYYRVLTNKLFTVGPRVATGGYLGYFQDTSSSFNPYYAVGVSGELSLGKGVTISLIPEYRSLVTQTSGQFSSLYSGVDISLSVSLEPQAMKSGSRRPKLRILAPEYRQIFPVIYKHYDQSPIGSVRIRNEEGRTISDVRIDFYVPAYMDGPQTIAEIDNIKSGDELVIPITALFQNSVLELTEKDSAQSQIIINYTVANASLTATRNETLRIYDRNSINWDDDRKAAAFVTAKDPTILKFSRNVVSEIGSRGRTVMNSNLADAIGLFEALKEYGLEYKIDPDSSYELLSQDESSTDYLQFPVQTLDYKSGDCDDLTILYSSMLESVSIETGFVTTPGHIYLAFSLDLSEAEARRIFGSTNGILIAEGKAWLPVEITLLNEGFLKAWEVGARQWREASANGNAAFYPVRSAWSIYEPTWFGSGENSGVADRLPDANVIFAKYAQSMDQFVQVQITPQVARLEEGIRTRPSPRLFNQLGTLYARYGLISKAEEQFRRGADARYMPSLVNLGNVYYLSGDLETALGYYEKARALSPENTDVLLSLARANFEIEKYEKAEEFYEIAQLLDPVQAQKFSYIAGGTTETARASDARERRAVLWTEE